jgi:hypothetical protein
MKLMAKLSESNWLERLTKHEEIIDNVQNQNKNRRCYFNPDELQNFQ